MTTRRYIRTIHVGFGSEKHIQKPKFFFAFFLKVYKNVAISHFLKDLCNPIQFMSKKLKTAKFVHYNRGLLWLSLIYIIESRIINQPRIVIR